jgi:DNA-binding CsgD family transcriptional regulator
MIPDSSLSDLIGKIYDAALDTGLWKNFLQSASPLFKSHIATIHFQDTVSSVCGFNVVYCMDPLEVERYIRHFAPLNPYMKHTEVQKEGRTYTLSDLVDTRSLMRTEFYNDWAGPQDLFDAACGTMIRSGSVAGNITFWRGEDGVPCGTEEIRKLKLLMPHLVRAMHIHRRVAGAEKKYEGLARSLDMICEGLLILRPDGKVIFANASALRIMRSNDGLKTRNDRIEADRPSESAAIRHAIQCASFCAQGRSASPVPPVAVTRRSLRHPFLLWAAPLPAGSPAGNSQPLIAIFVIDPEHKQASPEQALRCVFGLTAAESRLANELLQGKDLTGIAESFGISRNTARSQLQSIFAKTGTSRQAELIKLLANLGERPDSGDQAG